MELEAEVQELEHKAKKLKKWKTVAYSLVHDVCVIGRLSCM